uniref:Uncharacterized protein n=1 Tax=Ananas comosus var. bracteatus TaxID=296719 RepID=A0A6V7P7Y4_ANACO|nr:unnamed protein product [Ananas comosus var. bracteatus]
MAKSQLLLLVVVLVSLVHFSTGYSGRKLSALVQPQPNVLTYHNGQVLRGDIPVSILWYGQFTPTQKSIISDFLLSLTSTTQSSPNPSVSQWWSSIQQLYLSKAGKSGGPNTAHVVLANQVSDEGCSLGRSLTMAKFRSSPRGPSPRREELG